MYISSLSSYGENKGQGKPKPGFLREDGATMQPKKDSPKLPKIAQPKHQKKKLVGRRELPKKSLPDKFTAEMSVKPSNPASRAQMGKLAHIRDKWQEEALKANHKDLQKKVRSAKIYLDMLGQFSSLSKTEQKALHKWIIKHEKDIRKLHSARKMSKVTKKAKRVIKLLGQEIDFWRDIISMRKSGVSIGVNSVFKSVSTAGGKKVRSSIYDTDQPLPVFLLKHPKQKSAKLKDGIATLGGVVEMAAAGVSAKSLTRKQEDNYAVQDYFIGGRVHKLQANIEKQYSSYKTLEKEIQKVLSGLSEVAKKDAAVVSILLEARPERFVVVSTLLEALQNSLKRVAKGSREKMTPKQEAEQFLKEESATSTKVLQELDSKKKELEEVKSEAVSPSIKSVTLDGFWGDLSENPLTTKIGDLLPWLVAGFLIYKIKTER